MHEPLQQSRSDAHTSLPCWQNDDGEHIPVHRPEQHSEL
jgi:hypothetical protein